MLYRGNSKLDGSHRQCNLQMLILEYQSNLAEANTRKNRISISLIRVGVWHEINRKINKNKLFQDDYIRVKMMEAEIM